MFFLPSNTIDFKMLAGKVVDEHVGTGKSLEDCIVEVAKDKELTPEEIKRLVEKSNTELSLRHLRGENKKENFALAKFEDVVKRTHAAADSDSDDDSDDENDSDEELEKTSEYRRHSGASMLPRTRKSASVDVGGIFGGMEKKASGERKIRSEIDSGQYYALFDAYEKAKMEKAAAEFRIDANLAWLVNSVRGARERDLVKFASDVKWTHAGRRPQILLKRIGEAAGRGDLSKYATEYVPISDDSSESVRRIEAIYKDMETFRKQAEDVKKYEVILACTNEVVKRVAGC